MKLDWFALLIVVLSRAGNLFNLIVFFVFLFCLLTGEKCFYIIPEVFEEETNAQHRSNDHLQNITAASGIYVKQIEMHGSF